MKKSILFVSALASFALLNAQEHIEIETTPKPTHGYNWKFTFINMDKYPVDIEIIDEFYFDENQPNYRPILLPTTHVVGARKNSGFHFGYLRSTLDLASHKGGINHIIVHIRNQSNQKIEFNIPGVLETDMPITLIWHYGSLVMEKQDGQSIELTPVHPSPRHAQHGN